MHIGLPGITLRFYLGSSLAFCSGSSVRGSVMNEMSFLGSVSRRRRISMSVSQPIPVGYRLRPRSLRGEVNFIQCLCGYLDDENVTEVQARYGGTVSLAQLARIYRIYAASIGEVTAHRKLSR